MSGGSSRDLAEEIKQAVQQSSSYEECLDLVEPILMAMLDQAGFFHAKPSPEIDCQAKYGNESSSDSSSPTAPHVAKPKLQRQTREKNLKSLGKTTF